MQPQPIVSLPLYGRPKSPRLVARFTVRVRREGGSLSMTIPRHIARHWKLEPGARLVVRSTDEGVLLYPRYFAPFVDRPRTPVIDDEFDDDELDDDAHDDSVDDESPLPTLSPEEVATASAR